TRARTGPARGVALPRSGRALPRARPRALRRRLAAVGRLVAPAGLVAAGLLRLGLAVAELEEHPEIVGAELERERLLPLGLLLVAVVEGPARVEEAVQGVERERLRPQLPGLLELAVLGLHLGQRVEGERVLAPHRDRFLQEARRLDLPPVLLRLEPGAL